MKTTNAGSTAPTGTYRSRRCAGDCDAYVMSPTTCVSVDGEANGNVVVGSAFGGAEVDGTSVVVDGVAVGGFDVGGADATGVETPAVTTDVRPSDVSFPHEPAKTDTTVANAANRHSRAVALMPRTCAASAARS